MRKYFVWFFDDNFAVTTSASYSMKLSTDDFINYLIDTISPITTKYLLICDEEFYPISSLHFLDEAVVCNDF